MLCPTVVLVLTRLCCLCERVPCACLRVACSVYDSRHYYLRKGVRRAVGHGKGEGDPVASFRRHVACVQLPVWVCGVVLTFPALSGWPSVSLSDVELRNQWVCVFAAAG